MTSILFQVQNTTDTNMFDTYPAEDPSEAPPDDLSGWDANF